MKQLKLPFKSYTIMNNCLIAHFSCPDVYRLYVLSLTTDRELKTDTTLEQLADFVGEKATAYKGNSKSLSFTDKIRSSGDIEIQTVDGISYSNGNKVTRNIYTFKEPIPTQYRRITKGLIDLDLSVKLKGYIIKLFSITNPHSYNIDKSVNEMEKLLKMDKKTIKKYNEQLIEENLLEPTENGWLLKVEALLIDNPKKISDKVQAIFDAFDTIIAQKVQCNMQITKQEAIYLSAKKNGFKQIENLENWSNWLISGVSYHNEKQEDSLSIIL